MSSSPHYVEPSLSESAFNCPVCGAYAEQIRELVKSHSTAIGAAKPPIAFPTPGEYRVSLTTCVRCRGWAIWLRQPGVGDGDKGEARLIHPLAALGPPPHAEMPDEVQRDYEEARTIGQQSPRGSAALLRLAVQRLMPYLGQKGKDLNEDIKVLVADGLPVEVQRALDAMRVTGNEAVHPGEMALDDDTETVESLCLLLNLIVDDRIAKPKMIEAAYAKLPEKKRKSIEQRDGAAST